MRRSFAAVLVGFLVLAGLQAQPASAASKKPSKVGLVTFVKAGYDTGTNRTSLSLDWADAKRAEKYEIFVSKSPSMKRAKVYKQKSSKTTIKNLSRGKIYYFQVRGLNGKKHGSKSSVVARPTILRPGTTENAMRLRVMTYNVCSEVCDTSGYAPYPWSPTRQSGVLERVASSGADVVATQEAGRFSVPPNGYAQAVHYSAKRLFYNTARFDVAPGATPTSTFDPATGCRLSSEIGLPTGVVFLGRHAAGCRYAVWAELVERATGRSFMMVDVHLVSGKTAATAAYRRAETNIMLSTIKQTNTKNLPVVFAGDFNSHRETKPTDSVPYPMKTSKYYDAYDMARKVTNQHMSSYNSFRTTPVLSTKWGNHIDKIWIDPWKVRVDSWANFALVDQNGKLAQPIGSDHSPVLVDLRIK
ncbi:MAG: endonuclease/exonuclease/phosphatase family protein [Aeromicrobium sp.]